MLESTYSEGYYNDEDCIIDEGIYRIAYNYKKFCSHILQTYHVRIPPVYEDNKQQNKLSTIFYDKDFSFSKNWIFKRPPCIRLG
jgi:hypothetical protein